MARFRDRFFAGLDVRIAKLAELTDVASSAKTIASVHELAEAFHSLSGIGGTYGYDVVTKIAREAEEEMWSAVFRSAPPIDADIRHAHRAIERLRKFVAQQQHAALAEAS